MSAPKVTILMPACNVEKYVRASVESVLAQTLQEIEILCINDGSKDSTAAILDELTERDARVRVIHKENTGYGHSMNLGIREAAGEYIGIVETDDLAAPEMYESLYRAAVKGRADVVMANYYAMCRQTEEAAETQGDEGASESVSNGNPGTACSGVSKNAWSRNDGMAHTLSRVWDTAGVYERVILPMEHPAVFRVRPIVWAGIYRRKFLLEQEIRFNETPGASYQDLAFALQTRTMAERFVVLPEGFLHYRTDNAGSSVHSSGKIFCVADEYEYFDQYLGRHPEKREALKMLLPSLKYENYRWNCDRLTKEARMQFIGRMKREFDRHRAQGELDRHNFPETAWKNTLLLLKDPEAFSDLFDD